MMWLEAPASPPTTAEVDTEQVNSHLQYFPVIPRRTEGRALTPQLREEGAGSSINECLQPSLPCTRCTACIQVMNDFFPKK